jgi:transitional endoplasmic reticulum ATPase
MNTQGILQRGYTLDEQYKIMLFIKKGRAAETHRVKGTDAKLYFLKLFNFAQLHRSAFDKVNNLPEIEFLKEIKHPNIVSYKDSGEIIVEGKK